MANTLGANDLVEQPLSALGFSNVVERLGTGGSAGENLKAVIRGKNRGACLR